MTLPHSFRYFQLPKGLNIQMKSSVDKRGGWHSAKAERATVTKPLILNKSPLAHSAILTHSFM